MPKSIEYRITSAKDHFAGKTKWLSEEDVVNGCLTGQFEGTDKYTIRGKLFGSYRLEDFEPFKEALDKYAIEAANRLAERHSAEEAEASRVAAVARKLEASTNPPPMTVVQIRDSEGILGQFTAHQLKQKFLVGEVSAAAEFKHPDYEEWFPVIGLFSEGPPTGDQVQSENIRKTAELLVIVINELRDLKSQLSKATEQGKKIKWAARSAAISLFLIWIFGYEIAEQRRKTTVEEVATLAATIEEQRAAVLSDYIKALNDPETTSIYHQIYHATNAQLKMENLSVQEQQQLLQILAEK